MKFSVKEKAAFKKAVEHKFQGPVGLLSIERYKIFKEECIKLKAPIPDVNKYITMVTKYKNKDIFK